MENGFPLVSVVIPAKNEGVILDRCLKAIKGLNWPKEKLEILVIDGLSSDQTATIAKSYGAKVFPNPKQIVSSARNIGFQKAKGDLIAFTDADCVVQKNWLKNAMKYFDDNKVAAMGGPNLTPKNEADFGKAVAFVFSQSLFAAGSNYGRYFTTVKEVKHIPGCNAIYRKEILKKVMPVAENLLTGEDVIMNQKITDLGYKILYTPNTIVYHFRRSTPGRLFRQFYRFGIGRFQIGQADWRLLNLSHLLTGFFPLILLAFVLFASRFLLWLFLIIFLPLIYFFILAMIKSSFQAAKWVPLVILLIALGWSIGFLQELFFPLKKVAGK